MNGLGASEESVEVHVEKRENAVVQADAFPNAIAHEEAAVENRDLGVVTGEELAIDVDLDICVALIGNRSMRALGHGPKPKLAAMTTQFVARSGMGLFVALALFGCGGSGNAAGSIDRPHALNEPQALAIDILQTKGIADWDLTISALTEDEASQTDGQTVNARFDAVALLTASEQLPVTTRESFDFAILGGATGTTYVQTEQGCADGTGFDEGMSADVGETVEGAVCIPISVDDFEHADTLIAVTFNLDEAIYFGETAAPAA